jgi:hypothetical protein
MEAAEQLRDFSLEGLQRPFDGRVSRTRIMAKV